MNRAQADLGTEYSSAFARYAQSGDEAALRLAYELGRDAVRRQLNVLELSWIHHEALTSTLATVTTNAEVQQLTRAGAAFLSEALSAFEMVRRGYEEVRDAALIEKQHSEQLRKLADASIELNSTHSAASLMQSATQRAREVLGVGCCAVTIQAADGTPNAVWVAAPRDSSERWERLMRSPEGDELADLLLEPEPDVGIPLKQLSLHLDGEDTTWLGVALQAWSSRTLGSMHLFDHHRDRFSESDRSILVQLAQMTAVALDNVQLYERQHRTAVTLQRALLPEELSEDPRLKVATRYIPGEDGLNVGGDWYDLATLPGGRIVMAMGDIAGRGAKAAAVMGRVRTAWRAYALRDDRPETVVQSLNALIQDLDADHFSTVVHVLVNLDQRWVKIVNAGHPPPLLIRPDGATRYLQKGLSVPLATLKLPGYPSETVELQAGSTMVLYTDGLIERSEIALDERLRLLQESASGHVSDVESLCDRILERMLPEEAADDVALLAFQLKRTAD